MRDMHLTILCSANSHHKQGNTIPYPLASSHKTLTPSPITSY